MATASVTKASVEKPVQAQAVEVNAPTRREFLYYIWGASIALILGQATAGLIWFSLPRFKAGEFGGTFTYDAKDIPEAGAAPRNIPAGRFWLSLPADEGFVALYGVCTHLGCLPKWVDTNNRFECPCHGSKFQLNGRYIEGPAPRSLDRFKTRVIFEDGTTADTNDDGDPIPLNGKKIARVEINTGARIRRNGQV
ncbi:MAG: Rieske 2Fe-2S domain-containing protein [Anaerolineae bacterium]|nr:Rieske 2Fe-2S domain-containing protein [Anaerolineae bacterium]MBN8618018.1 Rieske 2Fe-2S domain-containing protein [Anaerolineae bacterium]